MVWRPTSNSSTQYGSMIELDIEQTKTEYGMTMDSRAIQSLDLDD
jgi:hypothetical protein